jgi:hypothetical protein
MSIKDYMYKLLSDLDQKGFILQYYTAYSTSSCYIKLDYGMSNSIRISDHKGIDKYPYRFNLMIDLDKSYEEDGRYYYSIKDYNKMIIDIKHFKDEQLVKYGFSYYEYMLNNKKDAKNKKGFWLKSKNYNDKF